MWSTIVFHCAAVRSVGYRSGWQRLQCIEYNSAPLSFFAAFFAVFAASAAAGAALAVPPTVGSAAAAQAKENAKTVVAAKPAQALSRELVELSHFILERGVESIVRSGATLLVEPIRLLV
jgi:hypothetical protein